MREETLKNLVYVLDKIDETHRATETGSSGAGKKRKGSDEQAALSPKEKEQLDAAFR